MEGGHHRECETPETGPRPRPDGRRVIESARLFHTRPTRAGTNEPVQCGHSTQFQPTRPTRWRDVSQSPLVAVRSGFNPRAPRGARHGINGSRESELHRAAHLAGVWSSAHNRPECPHIKEVPAHPFPREANLFFRRRFLPHNEAIFSGIMRASDFSIQVRRVLDEDGVRIWLPRAT